MTVLIDKLNNFLAKNVINLKYMYVFDYFNDFFVGRGKTGFNGLWEWTAFLILSKIGRLCKKNLVAE